MHLDCLPDSTREALERIQVIPAISKYVLIGGTALALQTGHRISEDLDFVTRENRLDANEIRSIVEAVSDGNTPKLVTPAAAREEMEDAGSDIDESHQDWLVNGVKITFFAPDTAAQRSAYEQAKTHRIGNVNVLDEEGIFRLKSMVLLDRRASRDLFDLWYFIHERGRSVGDVLDAMDARSRHRTMDDLLQLIAPRSLPTRDPGFATSLQSAPKTSAELLKEMENLVAAHRRAIAAKVISSLSKGPSEATVDLPDPPDLDRGR